MSKFQDVEADENLLKEMRAELHLSTSANPLIDIFNIFGDDLCGADDSTLLALLQIPDDKGFGFREEDAEEILKCLNAFGAVVGSLPNQCSPVKQTLWGGILTHAGLFHPDLNSDVDIDGEVLGLLVDRLDNSQSANLVRDFFEIFGDLIPASRDETVEFFIKIFLAPRLGWDEAQTENFLEAIAE